MLVGAQARRRCAWSMPPRSSRGPCALMPPPLTLTQSKQRRMLCCRLALHPPPQPPPRHRAAPPPPPPHVQLPPPPRVRVRVRPPRVRPLRPHVWRAQARPPQGVRRGLGTRGRCRAATAARESRESPLAVAASWRHHASATMWRG